jgi:alanyl-tRNA synthetase
LIFLTHFEKITSDEICKIESLVNREILINSELEISIKSFDDAKKEGAIAMFGEKYGEQVRVITVAKFSKELCGGTHVDRTGDIGFFKIVEESSLASGVRRLVAVTGPKAVEYVQNQSSILESLKAQLNCGTDLVSERVDQLLSQKQQLEKDLKKKSSSR